MHKLTIHGDKYHARACSCLYLHETRDYEQQYDVRKHVWGRACMLDCITRLGMPRMHAV